MVCLVMPYFKNFKKNSSKHTEENNEEIIPLKQFIIKMKNKMTFRALYIKIPTFGCKLETVKHV